MLLELKPTSQHRDTEKDERAQRDPLLIRPALLCVLSCFALCLCVEILTLN